MEPALVSERRSNRALRRKLLRRKRQLEITPEQRGRLAVLLEELSELFLPQLKAQLAPLLCSDPEPVDVEDQTGSPKEGQPNSGAKKKQTLRVKHPGDELRVLAVLLQDQLEAQQLSHQQEVKTLRDRLEGAKLAAAMAQKDTAELQRRYEALRRNHDECKQKRRRLSTSLTNNAEGHLQTLERCLREKHEAMAREKEATQAVLQAGREKKELEKRFAEFDERIHASYAARDAAVRRELRRRFEVQHKALMNVVNEVHPTALNGLVTRLGEVMDGFRLLSEQAFSAVPPPAGDN